MTFLDLPDDLFMLVHQEKLRNPANGVGRCAFYPGLSKTVAEAEKLMALVASELD